jgi:hypothetical protein
MSKSIIDQIGRETAYKLMEDAVIRADNRRISLGLPKPVLVNGVTFLEYPDGRVEKFDPSLGVDGIKPAKPQQPEDSTPSDI